MPRRGHIASGPQPGARKREADWKVPGARERAQELVARLLEAASITDSQPVKITPHFTKELFSRYGLAGMLQKVYRGSLFWAFADLFPDVRPWQVELPTPKSYWKGEQGRARAVDATLWMLNQLGFGSTAQIKQVTRTVTGKHFERIGLGGMLSCVYDDSARRALDDVLSRLR